MKIPSRLLLELSATLATFVLPAILTAQVQSTAHNEFPNFDRRADPGRAPSPAANVDARDKSEARLAREQAGNSLRGRVRNLRLDRDPLLDTTSFVGSSKAHLTGPAGAGGAISAQALNRFDAQDQHRVIKAFIDEYEGLFGHRSEILAASRIGRDYVTAHNGLRTIVWEQTLDDIPIFEATLKAHLTAQGELVNLSSRLLPDPERASNGNASARSALRAAPPISARAAVAIAARSIGEQLTESNVTPETEPQGADARQRFRAPSLLDADAHFVWLPINADTLRLAWEIICTGKTHSFMYRVIVDAGSGDVEVRQALTEHISNASYRVFTSDSPSPFSPGHTSPSSAQPPLVARTLVTTPALNLVASPDGWISDGVMETRGNNVDAHTDINADNVADAPRPQAVGANRVFDPPLDLTQSPATYRDAAVVNLFYWSNFMHDKLYELGFTEPAGNFQISNFGRGGLGNDAVQADAQDGSGVNNANFSTPPDGFAGRMQMYVFTGPNPDRDGDLDAEIILHEYTHGLSNRLVGGGVGMSAMQSRGMGEGWSDFYAMTLLSAPADDVNGNYASGGYSTYQLSGMTENYYFGIRRYPYSTNLAKNPLTFRDIDATQASTHSGIPRSSITSSSATEVHNMGEVWCVTLWDARANLINKHGAAAGNQLILQLVTDGMKLSPANPTFLQARDAILQADLVDTGGANQAELWAAFSKRGMGFSAYVPSSFSTLGLVENFDLPDDLEVTPFAPFFATGTLGSVASAAGPIYLLENGGASSLSWTATSSQPWMSLSATSGTLAPGAVALVAVTFNANANALPLGSYPATVTFTNVTSSKPQTRSVSLTVVPPQIAVFALNSDPGWTRNGEWAFGHPTGGGGTSFGSSDPANGATGTNVFGINLNGDYSTTLAPAAYLTAGPFNFSGYGNSRLQFQRWLNTDSTSFVTATIEVSRNGTSWTRIWDNGSSPLTANSWTKVQHDISALADNQPTVYIRWGHQVTNTQAFRASGWNIDDVELLGQSGAAAPSFVIQPASQTAAVGGNVTFQALASGLPSPGYQWYLNGMPIAGATGATLALNNVQLINAGTYAVVATNTLGSTTSAPATLSGTGVTPVIATHPANTTVVAGQNATFNVAASGAPPLLFQWRRNGFPIAGATGPGLNLPGVSRTDADYYDVLVGSGLTATTSQMARLSVAPTAYPGIVAPDPAWDLQAEGIPSGEAVLPLADGRTYIAGSLTSISGPPQTSVARINVDSTVDTSFAPPEFDGAIRTLALQNDGRLIVGGEFVRINGLPRNRIARLNTDGSLDPGFASGVAVNGQVLALRIQTDGRILVAGSFTGFGGSPRNFLVRLNADGSIDAGFLTRGVNSTINAVALQPDGKILIGGSFTTYSDINGATTARTRMARLNADGTLDLSFGPAPGSTVNDIALQADGKVVIAGAFTSVGGTPANFIARLTPAGALDTAFTTAGGSGFNSTVNALAVQADSRIVVGGLFTSFAGSTINRLARLNADGSRDTGFLTLGFNSTINTIAIAPTAKILVGGGFSSYISAGNSSTSRTRFARLNSTGTLDSGFNFSSLRGPGSINTMLPLPGGKMLVTGFFTALRGASSDVSLARLNANGTIDTTFNPGGSGGNSNIYGAALQPDGKIIITGFLTTYNGATANNIVRLNPDGTADSTFSPGAGLGGSSGYALAVLPGGRIFVGGTFTTAGGASRNRVAIFNGDGSLNTTFAPGTGASSTVYAAAAQPDGKILIGGAFTSYNGTTANRIARLNPNGTIDPTFATGTGANSDVSSIALMPDGRIVIGGLFSSFNGTSRSGVARLNANGSLDASFVPPTIGSVYSVLVQEDGKVALRGTYNSVGGASGTTYLARLNTDGSRDVSFASAGFVESSLRPSVLVMRDSGQLFMQSNGYAVMVATQPGGVPAINTAPANQIAAYGGSVTFTVIANSTLPLTYQWSYNGAPINGATGSSLTLQNLQLAQSGTYGVAVTNEFGTTNASATLTVNPAAAGVALANLVQRYDGTPKHVAVSTTPAGLDFTVTYSGAATAPTNPGAYPVVATIINPNYVGTAAGVLTIFTDVFVRHAPTLGGGVDGSLQIARGENIALNGNAWISGDLIVPGTPTLRVNGKPTYVGVRDGDGGIEPSDFEVALNGEPALRYLVRRVDPLAFPTVDTPALPSGTRTVVLETPRDLVSNFASIADLTLNGGAGTVEVPPGTYGVLTANGNSSFMLGVAGATVPAVYHVQTLALNGNGSLQIAGPVILHLANGLNLACDVGSKAYVDWLTLTIASGGLTLNGNATFAGSVIAPSGAVIINSNSTLIGQVISDSLTINANGQVEANTP